MMIEPKTQRACTKELKVAIPVRYHLQLHAVKVLEGRQIHSIVQEALDGYFLKLKGDQATD